ncbi:unnamed protein product [Amoebophrya sp. A120]|nr:unnamed protein product [Amoebophrya sp. A120]|eukprot:GSA120T00010335001.1
MLIIFNNRSSLAIRLPVTSKRRALSCVRSRFTGPRPFCEHGRPRQASMRSFATGSSTRIYLDVGYLGTRFCGWQAQELRQWNTASRSPLRHQREQENSTSREELCRNFNRRRGCRLDRCSKLHLCSFCGSDDHGAWECPERMMSSGRVEDRFRFRDSFANESGCNIAAEKGTQTHSPCSLRVKKPATGVLQSVQEVVTQWVRETLRAGTSGVTTARQVHGNRSDPIVHSLSRTDRGVHALSQLCYFDVINAFPLYCVEPQGLASIETRKTNETATGPAVSEGDKKMPTIVELLVSHSGGLSTADVWLNGVREGTEQEKMLLPPLHQTRKRERALEPLREVFKLEERSPLDERHSSSLLPEPRIYSQHVGRKPGAAVQTARVVSTDLEARDNPRTALKQYRYYVLFRFASGKENMDRQTSTATSSFSKEHYPRRSGVARGSRLTENFENETCEKVEGALSELDSLSFLDDMEVTRDARGDVRTKSDDASIWWKVAGEKDKLPEPTNSTSATIEDVAWVVDLVGDELFEADTRNASRISPFCLDSMSIEKYAREHLIGKRDFARFATPGNAGRRRRDCNRVASRGMHDEPAEGGSSSRKLSDRNTTRTLHEICVLSKRQSSGDADEDAETKSLCLEFRFFGEGFLRHMVRKMVWHLLEAGLAGASNYLRDTVLLHPSSTGKRFLPASSRAESEKIAPPQGLWLWGRTEWPRATTSLFCSEKPTDPKVTMAYQE